MALAAAISVAAAVLAGSPSSAGQPERRHALSLIGEPAVAADFQHFDWVNPSAPKGGSVRVRGIGSFDTLNRFANRGEAALGLNLVNAPLMATSLDEPSTEYGLVAAWASHPQDYSSVTFGLRPEARFHDGRPITVEDVVFTLGAIKAANPHYALYYKNVIKAERTGENEVTFTFDGKGNRELPQIVGSMPVLPRHFWQGKDDKGEPRDVGRGTLEIPLGSGPYRVKSVDPGRLITYERASDWWAKDLPVARGQWNFDEITFVYYRDRTPAFEAFKIGETDFWPENSAKGWATGYDIEAVRRGHIRKETLESRQIAGMQGFAFNLRRPKLQDPRVRQAFNLAFNFEWANKSMLYEQYLRVGSYFENSELKATGLPQGSELDILETVRGGVPPSTPPPTTGAATCRRRRSCLPKPGGRMAPTASPTRQGTAWPSSSCSCSRISSGWSSPIRPSSRSSASKSTFGPWTVRSTDAVSTPSISTSSSPASRNPYRPATSSAISGAPPPQARKAPRTSSASAIPPSTPWSSVSSSRRTGPTSWR
jgi:microcin C transport system substrate-binding protein